MTGRALLALVAVLLAACTGGDDDARPSPTTDATTSTSVVDLSGVVLPGVGGETTTTIDETGTARLVGSVRGPAGPLAGATVRVDRLVAGRELRRDVVTGPDGRWELRDVPGGRYRVRAFLAPTFAQTTAEVRFLADREEHTFDLVVDDQRGLVVRADAAPDQPVVGGLVNVVVLVVQRIVDPDGVVRSTPLAGVTVELSGLGRWVPRDDPGPPGTIDAPTSTSTSTSVRLTDGGRAGFELRCLSAGAPGLVLRVPRTVETAPVDPAVAGPTEPLVTLETVALDLPACAADTAASPTTSAGSDGSSTTTTSTTSSSSTTSPPP